MRSCIALLAGLGLGLGLTGRARADIPPPLPPAKDSVTVKIEVDEKAKGPRLVVPNGVFTPPRVRPRFPEAPKGELPVENGDGIGQDDTKPRHHLLIAGIAVSLALTFGGVWLIRKNGKGSMRGLALLIAAGATLTAGAIAWANAAPPLKDRPPARPQPVVNYPTAFDGKAAVEFTYGQEPVRLILDKKSYEDLKKGELKLPGAKPLQ
jgi:hypothetical protein